MSLNWSSGEFAEIALIALKVLSLSSFVSLSKCAVTRLDPVCYVPYWSLCIRTHRNDLARCLSTNNPKASYFVGGKSEAVSKIHNYPT